MSLGEIISDARKEQELSQKELAKRIKKENGSHISPQYLNDIEHNRRTPSSDHLLNEFSKVLDIDKDVLYYEVGQLPKNTRNKNVDEERVKEAYKAFRKELDR